MAISMPEKMFWRVVDAPPHDWTFETHFAFEPSWCSSLNPASGLIDIGAVVADVSDYMLRSTIIVVVPFHTVDIRKCSRRENLAFIASGGTSKSFSRYCSKIGGFSLLIGVENYAAPNSVDQRFFCPYPWLLSHFWLHTPSSSSIRIWNIATVLPYI